MNDKKAIELIQQLVNLAVSRGLFQDAVSVINMQQVVNHISARLPELNSSSQK